MLLTKELAIKAYHQDLRSRIIEAKKNAESSALVARRFAVATRTVERYWKRYIETSQVSPKRMGGYRKSRLADHDQELRRWIEQKPDLTLAEIQQRCWLDLKITISLHALWYRLNGMNLTFKKKRRMPPNKTAPI